jgi:Uma2 family endonuclease
MGQSSGPANERRDRDAKLKLYARRGVEEYWIVDWRQRRVELYRRAGDAFRLTSLLTGDDHLHSVVLPGFDRLFFRQRSDYRGS